MIFKNQIKIFFSFFLLITSGAILNINAQEISVMSYNIRYASPDDGPNLWDNRKEDMVKALTEMKPDVVGMQEVLHSQLLDLTDGMKGYSYVGVGRADGKTEGEYSPILFNKQRFKLIDSNTFWLSETPNQISIGWDAALERICTYALFYDKKSKKEFWVFNTHFDHVGTEARSNAALLILEQATQLNTRKIPVIITGDFNLVPEEKPIKILQSAYQDVQHKLSREAPNYGTFTGFDTQTVGDRRIDYIFQKGFELIQAEHLWFKTKKGLWVSDHHPVAARLSFRN